MRTKSMLGSMVMWICGRHSPRLLTVEEGGKWRKAVDGRTVVAVSSLGQDMKDSEVLLTGRVHKYQGKSNKLGFLVLREKGYSDPKSAIKGTTQQVEIYVRKVFCISKALTQLLLDVDAASQKEEDEQGASGERRTPHVSLDTRLNNRVLDLRTPANQAIFRVRSHIENFFRQYLLALEFDSIHTPKLLARKINGGASVFCLDYIGKDASLAQSAQLHKQMAISSGFTKVFDIGTYFRSERSSTNRHLTEFVTLNVEMELKYHYNEVMDLVDGLFADIFMQVNQSCANQLDAIAKQYPFEPLKFLPNTLRISFERGVQMHE
ncbi:predicted protein, partial [Arabidopsis lyrata subsp. lyrata]